MRYLKLLWYKLSYIISYTIHVFKNGDSNWDYDYLVDLIRWKLKRIEVDTSTWWGDDAERVAKRIRYATFLIDRWQGKDGYMDRLHEEHEKKWGKMVVKELPSDTLKGAVQIEFTYTKGDSEQALLESRGNWELDNTRKQDAKRRLFKHLEKYIETFWD